MLSTPWLLLLMLRAKLGGMGWWSTSATDMWADTRGVVAASSVVIKTISVLVIWQFALLVLPPLLLLLLLLELVLLWVSLVRHSVYAMEGKGPQLLIYLDPGFVQVPFQVSSKLFIICVHLVKRKLSGKVVQAAWILEQFNTSIRIFHAINLGKHAKSFVPSSPAI